MRGTWWFFGAYLSIIILFFLYSFTQIDLNLTLSRLSIWQTIEKFFQHIGYFQRPLSTLLYFLIIFFMYVFYVLFLKLAQKGEIERKQIWILAITTTLILTFSYNAFSYDLFNYIFDAKIVTYYQQNPFFHKALDYPGDPMLSFMRWTHRVYPYGPTWLFLTVPLSFIGFNIFLPTFFLFKALASASFLGSIFFIGKIARRLLAKNEVLGLVFFTFNPLLITESLVSAHNDIVMMFLLLFSLYLIMENKYIRSFLILALSVGIKFATLTIAPVFIAIYLLRKYKKAVNWDTVFLFMIGLLAIAIVIATLRTNFQPWYLLYVLPLAALVRNKYYIVLPTIIISFFANLQYVPFLYLGNWDNPVPSILVNLMYLSVLLSLIAVGYVWFVKRTRKIT